MHVARLPLWASEQLHRGHRLAAGGHEPLRDSRAAIQAGGRSGPTKVREFKTAHIGKVSPSNEKGQMAEIC